MAQDKLIHDTGEFFQLRRPFVGTAILIRDLSDAAGEIFDALGHLFCIFAEGMAFLQNCRQTNNASHRLDCLLFRITLQTLHLLLVLLLLLLFGLQIHDGLPPDFNELCFQFGLGRELLLLGIIGHVLLVLHLLLEFLNLPELLLRVLDSFEQKLFILAVWVL